MSCIIVTSVAALILTFIGFFLANDYIFYSFYGLVWIATCILISIAFWDRPPPRNSPPASRIDIEEHLSANNSDKDIDSSKTNLPNCKYSRKLVELSHGHTLIEQWNVVPNDENKENENLSDSQEGNLHILIIHGLTSFDALSNSIPPLLINKLNSNNFIINNKKVVSIIHYHLYGRGLSDCPMKSHDLSLYLTQVNEVLMNCNNFNTSKDKLIIFGFSMGGCIATAYTNKYYNYGIKNETNNNDNNNDKYNNTRVYKLICIAPAGLPVDVPFIAKFGKLPVIGEILFPILTKSELHSNLRGEYYDIDNNKEALNAYNRILKVNEIWFNKQKKVWYAILSTLRHFPMGNIENMFDDLYNKKMVNCNNDWLFILGDKDGTIKYKKFEKFNKCKQLIMKNLSHMDLVESYGVEQWMPQAWEWINQDSQ